MLSLPLPMIPKTDGTRIIYSLLNINLDLSKSKQFADNLYIYDVSWRINSLGHLA